MASRRDVVLAQVFSALGRGAGDTPWSAAATAFLHDRYSPWLDRPVDGKTPQDVWDSQGPDFLSQLTRIGRQAAVQTARAGGGEISVDTAAASAEAVEANSVCPYCPSDTP